MVKVTIALGSSRPGGVDISLKGLAEQTCKDFEVVFVDGRYHKRHAQVLEYAKKVGLEQPFYHVPNHRYNGIWGANVSGVNTGFMLAAGEILIMLMDYAYTPPGWIEEHLKWQDKPRLVMAPHLYSEMPLFLYKGNTEPILFANGPETTVEAILKQRENFDEISIFPKPFDSSYQFQVLAMPNNDPKSVVPTGHSPLSYNYMHTKNDSFPVKTVLEIGGMDEHYDLGRGPGDTEFGYRLVAAGLEPWICNEAKVYCPNPRPIMPNLNTTIPVEWTADRPNLVNRLSYNEGMAYFNACRGLIEKGGSLKALNPYDTFEMRKELWVWRELSQEKDPVIPLNDVGDEKYFGEECEEYEL